MAAFYTKNPFWTAQGWPQPLNRVGRLIEGQFEVNELMSARNISDLREMAVQYRVAAMRGTFYRSSTV